MVDEEDSVRRNGVPVRRCQSHLAGAERDDARAVGRDRRVVVPDPEATRRVALAVRQLREEEAPARLVEPRLEPGGVVASVASRRRCDGERERDDGGPRQRDSREINDAVSGAFG